VNGARIRRHYPIILALVTDARLQPIRVTLWRANADGFTPVPPETQSKPPPQPRRLSFVEVKVLEQTVIQCANIERNRPEGE